jgi:signal transduction histidine kinase/CheY-like chemotaxis protein
MPALEHPIDVATPPEAGRSGAGRRLGAVVLGVALALLVAVLGGPARAGSATFSAGDGDRVDLTTTAEWCETAPEVDVATVAAGGCAFAAATAKDLALGYSRSAFWLRLHLVGTEMPRSRRLLVIGNRRLEHVTFFDLTSNGARLLGRTGLAVAPDERIVPTPDPMLPVDLAAGEARTLLLQVVSRSSINLEPIAWREAAWIAAHDRFVFHVALANGGLIAVGLFSLMIGLGSGISQWSRWTNLFFAAGSITKALFNLANASLLPGRLMPSSMAYDIRFQGVALTASVAFGILYMRLFLDTRRSRRKLEFVYRLLLAAAAAETVWVTAIDYPSGFTAALLTAAAMGVVGTFAGWNAVRERVPGAMTLALAWTVYLALFVHRVVLGFAGGVFDDTLVIAYSWAALSTAPLIPIGIALNEEAIRRGLAEVRADAAARVAFLARMSHELRTPLDTILGNAQLMARPAGRVSVAEGVATILDAGRHLLRMIDDILDHARGLAGRLPVTPAPIDWPGFLRHLELEGRVLAARNRNRFTLTVRGMDPAVVEIDEGRLRQILDNLLANAARHTRDGHIDLTVTGGPGEEPGTVMLGFTVGDDGEGILPEDLERIFLPFERGANAVRAGKGMGMGLTIARQLVECMGGRLTVESRPGEGATFRFGFVVVAPAVEATRSGSVGESEGESLAGSVFTAPTVLVVDDDEANRRIVASLLASCGLIVVEAASGRAAIDLCRVGTRPDLVLTDQFMADGDGWSVLRALRDLRPAVPVVMISAALPQRPPGFPAGLDVAGHLMRPLDHAEVLRRVGELLGRPLALPPAPGPEPVAAEAIPARRRPQAASLAQLREMIDDGRVSDILDWAAETARDPEVAGFAEAVAAAARRLDFDRLTALAEA